MGIKTNVWLSSGCKPIPLKNLPTTWGLRPNKETNADETCTLKNLPTTWGLRLICQSFLQTWF